MCIKKNEHSPLRPWIAGMKTIETRDVTNQSEGYDSNILKLCDVTNKKRAGSVLSQLCKM